MLWRGGGRRAPTASARPCSSGGAWLVVTGLVFSLSQGIIHPYYTSPSRPRSARSSASAPPGPGRRAARSSRASRPPPRSAGTAVWAYELLDRTPAWHPALRTAVLAAGVAAALLALLPPRRASGVPASPSRRLPSPPRSRRPPRTRCRPPRSPHTGSIPTAGPAGASGFGGRGARRRLPGRPGPGLRRRASGRRARRSTGLRASGRRLRRRARRRPRRRSRRATRRQHARRGARDAPADGRLELHLGRGDRRREQRRGRPARDRHEPVMAIGGFNGTDPSPTLAQFQAYVRAGKIHYFLASGGGGFGRPRSRRLVVGERDRELGRVELHRADRGRRHRLRPDRGHDELGLSPDGGGPGRRRGRSARLGKRQLLASQRSPAARRRSSSSSVAWATRRTRASRFSSAFTCACVSPVRQTSSRATLAFASRRCGLLLAARQPGLRVGLTAASEQRRRRERQLHAVVDVVVRRRPTARRRPRPRRRSRPPR